MTELRNSSLYNEDLAPFRPNAVNGKPGTTRGALDQHEPLYTHLHAGEFADRRWYELWQSILTIFLGNTIVLVPMILNGHAGANTVSRFLFLPAPVSKQGHNIPAPGHRGLWLVRYPNLDRRIFGLPDAACVDTFPGNAATGIPRFLRLANRSAMVFLVAEYVGGFILEWKASANRLSLKRSFLPLAALVLLFWAINAGNGLALILRNPPG